MKKAKTPYLTSQQIYDQWLIWKETGTISEEMGKMMLLLAQKVMTMKYFNRYPQDMKDEMVQEGCAKIMKNLHNMKPEKKSGFFSYWTHCVFTAGMVYLSNYYKQLNNKRQMLMEAISKLESESASLPRYLKELAEELNVQHQEYSAIEDEA